MKKMIFAVLGLTVLTANCQIPIVYKSKYHTEPLVVTIEEEFEAVTAEVPCSETEPLTKARRACERFGVVFPKTIDRCVAKNADGFCTIFMVVPNQ